MTPKRGVLAAVVLAALSFAAPALRAQEDPRELERYERDRRIIDEKIIRKKCDVDRRAYEEGKRNLDAALRTRDQQHIASEQEIHDNLKYSYCKCLRDAYLAARRALPPEYYRLCDPNTPPLPDLSDPPPGTGNPPPAAPAASEPCDQAQRDQADQRYRDAKLNLKEAQLAKDKELIRLRERDLEAARVEFCKCLRSIYLATGRKPDNYDEICGSRGKPKGGAPPKAPVLIEPGAADPPAPADEDSGGENPPRKPRTRTGSGRGEQSPNPPPPPPPPAPPAGNPNPNAPAPPGPGMPAPPGPGMPAPPGPGMPAADCLREGVWNLIFTVEQHNDNHDHTVCVRFLRRLLKMTLGDFLGDLFAARFEDLLPQMECTKLPGCSGTCKGTLPQFAGKENVEFEIADLRRNGDTLTGKLVITSGGERLFVLRFTATPAVAP